MSNLIDGIFPFGSSNYDPCAATFLLFVAVAAGSAAGAAEANSKTLRFGYFLQESQPPYRIGAIKLAIDKAQADGWLPDYKIRYERGVSQTD